MAESAATETEIPPERAAELIEGDAELIDVRRRYEWQAGRIPGARNVEMNELQRESESIPRDRPVVFYCRSGSRSAMAATAFRDAGWDAYSIAGGLESWAGHGRELEPPDGEVVQPGPGS